MAKNGITKNKGVLAEYFPMIRTRQEVLVEIRKSAKLNDTFQQWEPGQQKEFLDFCTGCKGLKILYDGIFKEIFNPETTPERLERLLSLLLGRDVVIEAVLPNDSVRLGAESSLLYTDILIQQKDGSLCDVEIQKIGYAFPGQRSACYSADHLLRQYKKVRGEKGKKFDYRDIKQVYTIVFFEKSPQDFHKFSDVFCHKFSQKSDTGLELELLQEYFFLPLDIYKKTMENRNINNELEAWLAFLSFDEPERIISLITEYPMFQSMYQQVYEICLNMEKVMSVYSKELAELDKNTVQYMIDEMQAVIHQKEEELNQKNEVINQKNEVINRKDEVISQKEEELRQKKKELSRRDEKLCQKDAELEKSRKRIAELEALLGGKR